MNTNQIPQGWKSTEQGIQKKWKAHDFKSLWPFMEAIAQMAEQKQHHPDWCNSYNKLTVNLCSHDAGGKITQKDIEMAAAIDALAEGFSVVVET